MITGTPQWYLHKLVRGESSEERKGKWRGKEKGGDERMRVGKGGGRRWMGVSVEEDGGGGKEWKGNEREKEREEREGSRKGRRKE